MKHELDMAEGNAADDSEVVWICPSCGEQNHDEGVWECRVNQSDLDMFVSCRGCDKSFDLYAEGELSTTFHSMTLEEV